MAVSSPLGAGVNRFIWQSEFLLAENLKFLETESGQRLEKESFDD